MANTLNNTLNKVSDAVEAILSGGKNKGFEKNTQINSQGQTCLERFGMEARNAHLMRNEWKRDLQYTKLLVDAEYLIQTEFKVSSYEDRLKEQANNIAQKEAEKQQKNAEKQAAKKAKKEAREAKKNENAGKVKGGLPQDAPLTPKQMVENANSLKLSNPMNNMGNFNLSTYR